MFELQGNHSPNSGTAELIPCTYPGCKQTFRSRFSCKRHQLVHTKEKRFVCEQCGKKFSFAQHLREHSYRHTNLKPYVCGINDCMEAFRHSSELSLHRRTHPEYRLKKYQYVEKNKSCEKIVKGHEPQFERPSKSESTDPNVESLGPKELTKTGLDPKPYNKADDIEELDIIFLNCIHNITLQKQHWSRPVLPLPTIGWKKETIESIY